MSGWYTPGHCQDIDGFLVHDPGTCAGAIYNCNGKCCGDDMEHIPSKLNPESSELKRWPNENVKVPFGSGVRWREGQKIFMTGSASTTWRWLAGHVCSCGQTYHEVKPQETVSAD